MNLIRSGIVCGVLASCAPASVTSVSPAASRRASVSVVFSARSNGATNLYATAFEGGRASVTLLAAGSAQWQFRDVAIDAAGTSVVYVRDTGEDNTTTPGEVWTVSLRGESSRRVARCRVSCRTPGFLVGGGIIYGDYGFGLTGGVIRIAAPDGSTRAVYETSGPSEQCYVEVGTPRSGERFFLAVANDLGWACDVNQVFVGTAGKHELTMLPDFGRGRCPLHWTSDQRLAFATGNDCEEALASVGADGKGLRSPEPNAPLAPWRVVIAEDSLSLAPSRGAPTVIFRGSDFENVILVPPS